MHKIIISLLLFFTIISPVVAQKSQELDDNYWSPKKENINYFLYETDKGYTYVDKDFNPLMKDKYFNFAGRFYEDLAVASKDGYVGYINKKGKFIIPADFEYALPFHYGVAKVWKDGKPYLINKKGKILFENHNYRFIKYAKKQSFEPLFIVTTRKWKVGVIDEKGNVVIDTIYNWIKPFNEGLAVCEKRNGLGVINLSGDTIVPFGLYSKIDEFKCSRACVQSNKWKWNTVGIIDNKGKLLFKEENVDYPRQISFYDSLAVVDKDSVYELINTNGVMLCKSKKYIDIKYGYAVITDVDEKYNYSYRVIDKKGNVVSKNKNYGYDKFMQIHKKYNLFIYDDNYNCEDVFYHKDLTIIGDKRGVYMKWKFPNTKTYCADFTYIDPDGFKNGLLYVIFDDSNYSDLMWGYINEKGETIYRNKTQKDFDKGVKLNINYMEERGLYYCINSDSNDVKLTINNNKITLLLDSSTYTKSFNEFTFPRYKLCHSFKIINESQDTLLMQDRFCEQINVQAKDRNGKWRNIQTYIPTDVLTDNIQKLPPNKFWEFAIQSYSGGFKTKMRVVVNIPAIYLYDWKNITSEPQKLSDDKRFISNEIDCYINASQFMRSEFSKDRTESYPFEDYIFDRIVSIP